MPDATTHAQIESTVIFSIPCLSLETGQLRLDRPEAGQFPETSIEDDRTQCYLNNDMYNLRGLIIIQSVTHSGNPKQVRYKEGVGTVSIRSAIRPAEADAVSHIGASSETCESRVAKQYSGG